MVRGIGNDIIAVKRLKKSIERYGLHFLNRLFTPKEQAYCNQYKDPTPRFAGRFAAKEAIVKALGTGFGSDIRWHDIEVLNDERGKPIVQFSESLNERFDHPTVLLSISHCEEYATATALFL